MGGHPNWFQVTNLECIEPIPALPGSEMKDVIVVHTTPPGDAFSLVVTFEGTNSPPAVTWLGFAEAASAATPAIPATAEFWAESIGPGEEVLIGTATVDLVPGGNPGGSTTTNTSLYQARLNVTDANTIFVKAGVLQPGVYRIGCAVHTEWTTFVAVYADAYYQQDLLVRVAQQP